MFCSGEPGKYPCHLRQASGGHNSLSALWPHLADSLEDPSVLETCFLPLDLLMCCTGEMLMGVVFIFSISPQQTRLKTCLDFLCAGLPCLLNEGNKPNAKSLLVVREGLFCLGIRHLHCSFAPGCWWLYLCKFSKVTFFSFPFQLSQL